MHGYKVHSAFYRASRDIDIANMSARPSVCPSVRPSVCYVPLSDENGLTYRHKSLTLNISQTTTNMAIVTRWRIGNAPKLSNGTDFNDLE